MLEQFELERRSLSTSIFWHIPSERELVRRDFQKAVDT